ncbi:ABC transporter permease [Actinobacteria bacterium YIM 96077]|uniref:Transport permease protein n=1 Tax=Phytoactinopolyspora halophila TaxID=1981511 RepID=A0A329QW25_9ACTN|nr:ABC transporter permease [Phytoactinopolyspora halophila]AYY12883.1 ABC transporter permease [Actinobacteria bacterium YIM 96077]RAW16323.1 ABC transporter permease [Phytoactinopolyspora halophila]
MTTTHVWPTIPATATTRLRATLADSWLMTRRNLVYWIRSPEELFGSLVFPLITVLLFGYVFGNAIPVPGGGEYREFLMPGLFAMTMIFGLVITTGAVVTDTERGVTDRFRAMPISSSAVMIGRSTSDMVRAGADLLVLIGCGALVGWRSHGTVAATLGGLGLLLLLRLALIWVGIYLGLILRTAEGVSAISPLVLPFAMVSNAFVAPALMPSWLGTVAEFTPMSATVTATRELFGNPGLTGESWAAEHATLLAVLWPLVLILVFFPLAVGRYRRSR